MYCIINDQQECWNNEHGWTDWEEADYFTADEQEAFNLPTGGRWISLWELNGLQFARLIAECTAAGVFVRARNVMESVYDSMDLTSEQVSQIIERAQRCFDLSKEKL
jgi:hypothetical protein